MKFVSKLSQETIVFTELLVKDYKNLLKGLYGEDIEPVVFVDCVCELLASITNKSEDYFRHMNIIDLFCLLLDVRINSMGNICSVNLTKANNKKAKLDLNLEHIKKSLSIINKQINSCVSYKEMEVELSCPSINNLISKKEELSFIKKVSIKGIPFNITTNEQLTVLTEYLPVNLFLDINQKIKEIIKTVNSLNFLSVYGLKEEYLGFNLNISSIIWYIKLFFEEPLDVFYKNFFYLSYYGHMNASYLESISIGEYNYFVRCLKDTLSPPKEFAEDPVDSGEPPL